MDIFKQASKERLRFQTSRGELTTEQLWDLNVNELDALAVSLEEQHEQSGKKSFLTKRSAKDRTTKLRFDVVIEILSTKVEDDKINSEKLDKKARNQKIMDLIAKKKDEDMEGKSLEELTALLEED